MRIHLNAGDVKLELARDGARRMAPSITSARDGGLFVELTRAELRDLLIAILEPLVEEHGVKIESADLELSSDGDRALRARLHVRAKKLFVSLAVAIDARAVIDERLSLTLSDLHASGAAPIASVVAGVLEKKLGELEGRAFDLAPDALANVRLQGISVETVDPLRIAARFEA